MTVWVRSVPSPVRFIEREGQRVLQQVWTKGYWLSGKFNTSSEYEWRDVPLTTEDAPELVWSESGYT